MSMRIALAVLCSVAIVGPATAEDPVLFHDPILQAAVEDALWISNPTPTDMLTLTYLNVLLCDIADITGLEYATNVQVLWLNHNKIEDISPLAGLRNLQWLALDNNRLSDISALAEVESLQELNLHDNQISDISALAGLSSLQVLVLRVNSISDISVLAGLTDLRRLDLCENQISDISPLSGLTSLEFLDLRGNPLAQEMCDIYVPQIAANNPGIELKYTPCGQLPVEHHVRISSTNGGSVVHPGEGHFTCKRGDILYIEAQPEPEYVFVGWSGSLSSTANPLYWVAVQDLDIRANFASVPTFLYVDDDASGDSHQDGTSERPFNSIQETIEVAASGTTVIVHPGTYHENINLLGKSIQLTGLDPDGGPLPVIDGNGVGPVISFTKGEDPNCMVVGFVITGGRDEKTSAVLCTASSPVMANCLIVGNLATAADGAAVCCTDSNAVFVNCTIADNLGAGLMLIDSNPLLANSIVWDTIALAGTSQPAITYCDIAGTWPGVGNIDADPLFARPGHWAEVDGPDALWVAGDYHLKSQAGRWDIQARVWVQDEVTSPCIDAGNPADPVDAEPLPNGGIVNLGAYGGTAQASKSNVNP